MTTGVLMYCFNTPEVNYHLLAERCVAQIRKYLKLEITIVTNFETFKKFKPLGMINYKIVDNKTGLLFSSSDHHSLSEKLDFIFRLDDTSLNVMGNNGRKNVQKKFNVEKMCFSTYSEYKKLINA